MGDGPNSYQLWLGGSPALTRTAYAYQDKVKMADMDNTLLSIFKAFKADRKAGEAFGDWTHRLGADGVKAKVAAV